MAPPLPEAPPVIAAFRPSQPVSVPRKGNRGLIIGLIIGGCVLVFLVLGVIGAWIFVRGIKPGTPKPANGLARGTTLSACSTDTSWAGEIPLPSHAGAYSNCPGYRRHLRGDCLYAGGRNPGKSTVQGDGRQAGEWHLTLAQGNDFIPDQQVLIFLFLKPGESTSGKTILVPDSKSRGTTPHVHVRWKENTVGASPSRQQ